MRRSLFILAVLLGLEPTLAFADCTTGTCVAAWTLPTKNTDGSTIAASGTAALKETRLYVDGVMVQAVAVPATTFTFAQGQILGGSHSLQMTVATNGGAESAKTTALPFAIPLIPQTPTGVSIQ